jgi:hypothetical protein
VTARADDIPAAWVAVAADVLDAIDPALPAQAREAAARRAVDANPVVAVGMLATLLGETYEALADLVGVSAAEFVIRLRRTLGARLTG